MKTAINIIIATALLSIATNVTAKSWRINNNAAVTSDFTSINAAMSSDDVTAGDTLYLDPGCAISGEQNVTKQVTIIGAGYNGNLPYQWSTIVNLLRLYAENTKVEAVCLTGGIELRTNHLHLERCWVKGGIKGYGTSPSAIIRQCYLTGSSSGGGIISGQGSTDLRTAYWTIENCIIYSDYPHAIAGLYGATIANNYISSRYGNNTINALDGISNSRIENNIIVNRYNKEAMFNISTDCVILYNILSCSPETYPNLSETNLRIGSNAETDLFVMSGSNDFRFKPIENSPAKGAASDGGDCGPFGGAHPYVMGGLPMGHPYYTRAVVSPKSVNGKVSVSLNIKMQNE